MMNMFLLGPGEDQDVIDEHVLVQHVCQNIIDESLEKD